MIKIRELEILTEIYQDVKNIEEARIALLQNCYKQVFDALLPLKVLKTRDADPMIIVKINSTVIRRWGANNSVGIDGDKITSANLDIAQELFPQFVAQVKLESILEFQAALKEKETVDAKCKALRQMLQGLGIENA